MEFRGYMILMALASSAAWLGWVVTVFSIDPARTGWFGIGMFYLTLGMALLGTLAIAGAGVRVWRNREELASRIVTRALRQSILLTTLAITSLALLSHGLFHPFPALMLIGFLALIEFIALSISKPSS